MANWQYLCKTITWADETEKQTKLNLDGANGWELVEITSWKEGSVWKSRLTYKKTL